MKKVIAMCLLAIMVFCVSAFASDIDGPMYVEAYIGLQTKIPALMYHKITDNPDELSDWTITGDMLKEDFAEIKERGYSPITVADYYYIAKLAKDLSSGRNYKIVAEFFRNHPKPIILTFDDGYKGIYTHVLPLLKEYGFRASFYITGELIDSQHPEYCTWDEIKEMIEYEFCDIGNHTYSLHSLNKEDLSWLYRDDFESAKADINKNKDVIYNNTGFITNSYSFPYGEYDLLTLTMLRTDYNIFISTDYRINTMRDNQQALGRFNRSAFISTEEYFDMVDSKCQ